MHEQVVLVNDADAELGTMEKLEAHRRPALHRAFSIFLMDSQQRMLLQQRAASKYHSALLWTNTCCSHPRPGEAVDEAANRRLFEEMGISTRLYKAFDFVYKAELDNGLYEHEFDHVFLGNYDGEVQANPDEVASYCYKTMEEIAGDLLQAPARYTAWFRIAFPLVQRHLEKRTAPTETADS